MIDGRYMFTYWEDPEGLWSNWGKQIEAELGEGTFVIAHSSSNYSNNYGNNMALRDADRIEVERRLRTAHSRWMICYAQHDMQCFVVKVLDKRGHKLIGYDIADQIIREMNEDEGPLNEEIYERIKAEYIGKNLTEFTKSFDIEGMEPWSDLTDWIENTGYGLLTEHEQHDWDSELDDDQYPNEELFAKMLYRGGWEPDDDSRYTWVKGANF